MDSLFLAVHRSTCQFQGLYLLIPWIRITLKSNESQVTLGFTLLDNQLTIDYIKNQTYIFEPVKRQLTQVNCLLNLTYEFKYDMAVNIIRYKDGLIYTFNAQAVNHLSPHSGLRFHYLKIRILIPRSH